MCFQKNLRICDTNSEWLASKVTVVFLYFGFLFSLFLSIIISIWIGATKHATWRNPKFTQNIIYGQPLQCITYFSRTLGVWQVVFVFLRKTMAASESSRKSRKSLRSIRNLPKATAGSLTLSGRVSTSSVRRSSGCVNHEGVIQKLMFDEYFFWLERSWAIPASCAFGFINLSLKIDTHWSCLGKLSHTLWCSACFFFVDPFEFGETPSTRALFVWSEPLYGG